MIAAYYSDDAWAYIKQTKILLKIKNVKVNRIDGTGTNIQKKIINTLNTMFW